MLSVVVSMNKPSKCATKIDKLLIKSNNSFNVTQSNTQKLLRSRWKTKIEIIKETMKNPTITAILNNVKMKADENPRFEISARISSMLFDATPESFREEAIGFALNYLEEKRRYECLVYILNPGFKNKNKKKLHEQTAKYVDEWYSNVSKTTSSGSWTAEEVKKAIKHTENLLKRENDEDENKVVGKKLSPHQIGQVMKSNHYQKRLKDKRRGEKMGKDESVQAQKYAEKYNRWIRSALDKFGERKYCVQYDGDIYVFGNNKQTAITVFFPDDSFSSEADYPLEHKQSGELHSSRIYLYHFFGFLMTYSALVISYIFATNYNFFH